MNKTILSLLIILTLLLGGLFLMHKDLSSELTYVTSDSCAGCHQSHFDSWQKTLHHKMFRPVTSDKDIQGDFSKPYPEVTFKRSDIEFVVGNKWEQVYVQMIEGEYYPFPAKWMITTQKWQAYKVGKWKQTPMSNNCNGCHTTGFNAESSEFTEFGIGCESCHGPGSQHVNNKRQNSEASCKLCHEPRDNKNDIIISHKASVCGQCHNRGSNKAEGGAAGKFKFPINFKPGDDLNKAFDPLTQKKDKKGKYWWGNGISKNRHQEYADWQNSKHNKALILMQEKYEPSRGKKSKDCLGCHSADYILAKADKKPELHEATNGITCSVCHDPHGFDKDKNKHSAGGQSHALGTAKCAGCHIDSMTKKIKETGRDHYPCPPAQVTCADCHMPRVVTTGGDYTLRSHAFKIITPQMAVKGQPNSCQNSGCHGDRDLNWAKEAYKKHYGK